MMEAGAVRCDSPTCEGFWVLLCFVFKGEELRKWGFYNGSTYASYILYSD
jgi:hypothetical protein